MVQVYASQPAASVPVPRIRLVAFDKVFIPAGTTNPINAGAAISAAPPLSHSSRRSHSSVHAASHISTNCVQTILRCSPVADRVARCLPGD